MTERVEQNIEECWDKEAEEFDWDTYQYLCDLGDYWCSED